MSTGKELTQVTKELLERTNILKVNGKKSMMKGEVNVLNGITIFEVILQEINPEVIDGAEVKFIENYVSTYMNKKEEQTQMVNNYVHYGIDLCFKMLESFLKEKTGSFSR